MSTSPASVEGADTGGLDTYEPTILDLSLGVPRPWPTAGDLALLLTIFLVQVALTDDYYSLTTAIYGGLEASILALLVIRYVKVRPHRLPWVELMAAEFYLQFGLALLAHPTPIGLAEIIPRRESFEFGSFVALISGLAMIAGFFVMRRLAHRFNGELLLPRLDREILADGSLFHLMIAAFYVLLNLSVPSSRSVLLPVANIIQAIFYHTPLLVVAMATYLAMPRPLHFIQVLGAFGVLAIVVATSSMLGEILVPLVGVAPLWWRARERVPVLLIAASIAIVVVLQPVKSHYRSIRDSRQTSGIVDTWEQAFAENEDVSRAAHIQHLTGSEDTISRLTELSSLAYTVEMVPDSIPHTGGIVYPMFLTSVIPRVFWPDKPNMTRYALTPFTVALGLTTPEAAETSVTGITLTAQGYLEHGIAGSIGWMTLFGVMVGLISRYFGTKLPGVVAGSAVLGPLTFGAVGGFQGAFGSAWQEVFGATLLAWVLWCLGGGYRREVRSSERAVAR